MSHSWSDVMRSWMHQRLIGIGAQCTHEQEASFQVAVLLSLAAYKAHRCCVDMT